MIVYCRSCFQRGVRGATRCWRLVNGGFAADVQSSFIFCRSLCAPIVENRSIGIRCAAQIVEHIHIALQRGEQYFCTGQMQESMARFKQGGRAEYGKVYGRLLWDAKREWLQRIREPVLVPVPVHSKRYRKRGYNQAEEIAKEMARLSGLPMRSDLLVRVKHTAPQKELSKRERSRNLQGAFRCRADYRKLCLQGKCAIIIDDIYTTGSTVEACSQTLLQAGFDKVYFLCVCIGKGV